MVSRAQAAYSQAQAHAKSFESTRSANEKTTANHPQRASSEDNEDNWLEDVAKVAGWISAGAATAAVLTAWMPEIAVVSLAAGFVALTADGILATEGKQTLATVIGDMAALVPDVGVLKEGERDYEWVERYIACCPTQC